MKSRVLFSSFVLASIALAACSSAEEPAPFQAATDLESRLEADTGVAWAVARESPTASPRLLGPTKPVSLPGTSFAEKTLAFFARYGAALGPGEHALALMQDRDDDDGSHETALAETIPGSSLPVFDSVSSARYDAKGNLQYIQSGIAHEPAGTPTSARVPEPEATRSANAYLQRACGAQSLSAPTTQLGALPRDGASVTLAYRLAFSEEVGTCAGPTVFVDAGTGAVLEMREYATELQDRSPGGAFHYWRNTNDVKTFDVSQTGSSTYELRASQGAPVSTSYYAQDGKRYPVRMNQTGAWDTFDKGISVDAFYHSSKALEYFRTVHGRNGLDGRGTPLVVVTHDNSPLNTNGDNAHYQPWSGEIHIGDGTPRGIFLPLSLSFDVIAHELAHGIIASTSNLVYEGQSGALNEAFADAMGVSAAHWLPELKATADMRIARLATKSGAGIRDMSAPLAFGQPEALVEYTPCGAIPSRDNDHCGVHHYSGIPNRAFSLMTLGGGQGDVAIPKPLGFEASRYVWFRSMTNLRNPRATFREAAFAQIFEAGTLGIDAVASVGCAWVAVGVLQRAEFDRWGNLCGKRQYVSGCAAVGNGYACHESAPYAAYVCKNGSIAGGINCVKIGQRCQPRSPTDPTATVNASGLLNCQ